MTRREVVNGWEYGVDRTVGLHIHEKLDLLIKVNLIRLYHHTPNCTHGPTLIATFLTISAKHAEVGR